MGLVIEGLTALGLILLVLWLVSLRGSVVRDQAGAAERAKQEQEAAERAAREALLYREGEKLRCLGCEHTFTGPLPDTGCPHCHLSALIVPESAHNTKRQRTQKIGFHRKED